MKPFEYLEKKPSKNAPISDNPSGLYCPDCRSAGISHCASPEYCGGMRRMKETNAVKILHNRYLKGHPIRMFKVWYWKQFYKIKDTLFKWRILS